MAQPSTTSPPDTLYWPEQLRAAPPHDRFPSLMIALWLLPGLLIAAMLLGVLLYLEQRASKQIVYIAPSGRIGVVRVDGAAAREIALKGFEETSFTGRKPLWSPRGDRWAIQASDQKVLVVQSLVLSPTVIAVDDRSNVSMPEQPWSFDGMYMVMQAVKDNKTSLYIADVEQQRSTAVDIWAYPYQPPSWNPTRNELLTTVFSTTSPLALRVITPDGQVRPFEPNDQQAARMFGVWSPDGSRVAYIGARTADERGGSIWIANSDGGDPKLVVGDGYNTAPVWSPSGDALFFTRIVTDSVPIGYDLYRVQTNGQNAVRVGRSVSPDLIVRQGQSALIDWSPNGLLMYFQSDERDQRTIYVASADGSNARPLVRTTPNGFITAHWSPTNRAVLVSDSDGTRLIWLDKSRPTLFPTSKALAWQP